MIKKLLLSGSFIALVIVSGLQLWGANPGLEDPYEHVYTASQMVVDTIPPIEDRYGDFLTNPNTNPFDLNDPAAVEQTIEYDPVTGQYIITERIGELLFRPPTYISLEDYMRLTQEREQQAFFDQLAGFDRTGNLSADDPLAGIDVSESLLNRLFGSDEIDIQPQGSIDLTFGFDYQFVNNPVLTQRQQRNGGFDFDMAIQMNAVSYTHLTLPTIA